MAGQCMAGSGGAGFDERVVVVLWCQLVLVLIVPTWGKALEHLGDCGSQVAKLWNAWVNMYGTASKVELYLLQSSCVCVVEST